jgi:hypothetical protein
VAPIDFGFGQGYSLGQFTTVSLSKGPLVFLLIEQLTISSAIFLESYPGSLPSLFLLPKELLADSTGKNFDLSQLSE